MVHAPRRAHLLPLMDCTFMQASLFNKPRINDNKKARRFGLQPIPRA